MHSDLIGMIESRLDRGETLGRVMADIAFIDYISEDERDALALWAWAWCETGPRHQHERM